MSEIPELPSITPLSRPLPPGGLDRAMRVGAQRRNRFLGAAGGSTTALALIVALLAAAPDQRDDSLRVADPEASASAEPSSTAAPAPEPSEEAEPGAEPAATPAPSSRPGPEAEASEPSEQREPDADQEPQPEPRQEPGGEAAVARETYVEEPVERAAPTACQGAPRESQPLVASGSSCSGYSSTSPRTIQGGQASATASYCVSYQEEDYLLRYDTGREHEVRVYRGEGGPLLYTFSNTVRYAQGAHTRRIGAGRCLSWTGIWDTTLADGSLAPPGEYWMMMTLEVDGVNDWPDDGEYDYGGGIGFQVTVSEG